MINTCTMLFTLLLSDVRQVSSQQVAKLDITHVRVLSSCLRVKDTARGLGVVIDSQLSLSAYVMRSVEATTTSCASCGRLSGRCLKMHATKTLVPVHAFVSCRLDYCNSLFFSISWCLMNRLQSVQNAADVWLLELDVQTTSSVLRQLHWGRVRIFIYCESRTQGTRSAYIVQNIWALTKIRYPYVNWTLGEGRIRTAYSCVARVGLPIRFFSKFYSVFIIE